MNRPIGQSDAVSSTTPRLGDDLGERPIAPRAAPARAARQRAVDVDRLAGRRRRGRGGRRPPRTPPGSPPPETGLGPPAAAPVGSGSARSPGVVIGGVHRTAGEHVRPRGEHRLEVAAQHEDLQLGCVPNRAGRSQRPGVPPVHSTGVRFRTAAPRPRFDTVYAGAVTDPRRALPAVDRVLDSLDRAATRRCSSSCARAPRSTTPGAGWPTVGELDADSRHRRRPASVSRACRAGLLQPVVNATGVLLHTNLGRAPLSPEALAAAAAIGGGYSNLEYRLDDGHARLPPRARRGPARPGVRRRSRDRRQQQRRRGAARARRRWPEAAR